MVAFVLFVNMFNVLIFSSLWIPVVWATDLNTHQGYHNVCDWQCLIQDASPIVKKFEMEVAKEETRALKLPIRSQLYSKNDICQNTSYEDISNSYLMWAASEKEPYLYIPSNFFLFSGAFSLHSRQETKIHMNCTREEQKVPLNEHNGTSLSDAVMKSVRQELIRTTGGTLCYHYNEYVFTPSKNAYKCCQFDMSGSDIICNVVYPPVKYVDWFQAVQIIWCVLAGITFLYLPALICLFPAGPKVSRDTDPDTNTHTPCIELGDPSPAGFRMFVAKVIFVPQEMKLCKDKAKFVFLRLIAFPFITGFPLLIYILYLTPPYDPPCSAKIAVGAVLGFVYLGKSVHFASSKCKRVKFTEALKNWSRERDAKIKSFSSRCFSLVNICSQFEYPESKSRQFFCTLAIFLFGPVVLLVLFFLFVICIILFYIFYCPLIIGVLESEMNCKMNCKNYKCDCQCFWFCVGSLFSYLGICLWLFVNVAICAALLPYSIMAVIDYEQDVLPRVSLALLILYYFHTYFTKFSEKYQLLKLELYEGIQKHHTSTGNAEDVKPLLLKTESECSVAIPEKLYEAACKELHMCMITDALWAFLKFICLSTFVFSFFCSVMIFGDRSGSGNLTKVVATFLAGFLPTLLTLFSSSDGSQTLKNIERERRLKDVITKYASRELGENSNNENTKKKHNNQLYMKLMNHAQNSYGSTSTTGT